MTRTAKQHYDIIIAGGGAAGLSLAYKLSRSSLSELKVLIIDKDEKTANDRTWSFWSLNDDVFPEATYKSWHHILIKDAKTENRIDISPYKYQMIRGIDFYKFTKREIAKNPNFTLAKDEIIEIIDAKDLALVKTLSHTYSASLVFNSIPPAIPDEISQSQNFLLQHFKGYLIETPAPEFSPELVHFMDFSVEQKSETRFGYVLPYSETKALVEFTLFSDNLLPDDEYTCLLNDYIKNNLNIQNYRILEQEFGIIPMTDIPVRKREGLRIYNIGSRGGMTKASTGYTFRQIQTECTTIVKNLEAHYPNLSFPPFNNRFRLYDSVLLHVLAGNLYPADQVFSLLFARNKAQRILKFLEEKTNIFEDLSVLFSLPSRPFLKGALRTLFNKGTKKNMAKISIEQYLKK